MLYRMGTSKFVCLTLCTTRRTPTLARSAAGASRGVLLELSAGAGELPRPCPRGESPNMGGVSVLGVNSPGERGGGLRTPAWPAAGVCPEVTLVGELL
jgi:hypothetical protein